MGRRVVGGMGMGLGLAGGRCARHAASCCPLPASNQLRQSPSPPLPQVWTVAEVADRPGGTIYATGRALYVTPRAAADAQPQPPQPQPLQPQ